MSEPVKDNALPAAVERFVQQLVVTYKTAVLYPPSSTIPATNADETAGLLEEAAAQVGELSFVVSKQGLTFEGAPVLARQAATRAFALELYHRSVSSVRFRAGTTAAALLAFLTVMRRPPVDIEAAGGFSASLWDESVDTVTVTESTTSLIEADSPQGTSEDEAAWPPDQERISRLLVTAKHPGSDGHRILVRVLLDRDAVGSYLSSVYQQAMTSGDDEEPATALAAMARIISGFGDDERAAALHALADSARSLPRGRVRARVLERLLATARTDRSVAALVRQVGMDEVCKALMEGRTAEDASAEGLARAIRNLAQISLAARDEVANAAGAAMRGAGLAEDAVSSVLATALPSRLDARSRPSAEVTDTTVDEVLRLMEAAASTPGRDWDSPDLRALRDEAHSGFSDSDVTGSLVTVAVLSLGTPEFADALASVEDSLGLLVERGEFEVAADTAETLLWAAERAAPDEHERILGAVGVLAATREMRALHRAMHVYERDTPEHVACKRLLAVLGTLAIDPLLEMLADEPDMAVRKSMVDLISSIADRHVEEIGRRVTDGRWYFVRNVVSILGSTKRTQSVPFLGRTLRHADARVRRESIRALAAIPDPRAADLLVTALGDADGGNVQLAARYLGGLGHERAVTALIEVARGEGAGNRDHAARSEAIEALGQIGSPNALPALGAIASRRSLVGGSRAKDLAAVASVAIEHISRRGGASE